jgi:hypothetical protein
MKSGEAIGSPGKYLMAERESRGLSLKQIADATRIREVILKAIEEDRYENLVSTYVKGFLSAYARCLGLNPNEFILLHQEYMESLTPPKMPVSKQWSTSAKKRVNIRFFAISIFAALFIAIFIYASFKLMHRVSPSLPKKESMPAPASSAPSSPPIREEAKTQTSDQPEKNQTQPMEINNKDTVPQESVQFKVMEVELGTGIERKDGFLILTGKSSEFVCNNPNVYFLTRIKAEKKGKIVHVWLWQGQELHRNEIEIMPPELSVYSFITLKPSQAGNWIAEARCGDKIIASLSFKAIEATSHSTYQKY